MPTTTRPVTPALHVPSRRTVLRAAAWTAPAVSVAVAVPAYAACSPVGLRERHLPAQVGRLRDYNAQRGRRSPDWRARPAPARRERSADRWSIFSQLLRQHDQPEAARVTTSTGALADQRGRHSAARADDHAARPRGDASRRPRSNARPGDHPQLQPAGQQPVVQAHRHRRQTTWIGWDQVSLSGSGRSAERRAGSTRRAARDDRPMAAAPVGHHSDPWAPTSGGRQRSRHVLPAPASSSIRPDVLDAAVDRAAPQRIFLTDFSFTASSC